MANTTITGLTELTAANLTDSHYIVVENGSATTKVQAFSVLLKTLTAASTPVGGASVLKSFSLGQLVHRPLVGGGAVSVTENTNDITIGLTENSININNLANIASFDLSLCDNSTSGFLTSIALGNATGTLAIANGGTGKTSLASTSVLLGGTTVREATLNTDLQILAGTSSGPEVKRLVAGNRTTITQNNTSDTITVAVDDSNLAVENTDATFNTITVSGLSAASGGTVTQATSFTTGVTLNGIAGTITLYTGTIAADTNHQFTVTNSAVTANSVVFISKEYESNTAANNAIAVSIAAVNEGNFVVNLTNNTNATSGAIVRKIHFFVFR